MVWPKTETEELELAFDFGPRSEDQKVDFVPVYSSVQVDPFLCIPIKNSFLSYSSVINDMIYQQHVYIYTCKYTNIITIAV